MKGRFGRHAEFGFDECSEHVSVQEIVRDAICRCLFWHRGSRDVDGISIVVQAVASPEEEAFVFDKRMTSVKPEGVEEKGLSGDPF